MMNHEKDFVIQVHINSFEALNHFRLSIDHFRR